MNQCVWSIREMTKIGENEVCKEKPVAISPVQSKSHTD
jgi:hypothetical protein